MGWRRGEGGGELGSRRWELVDADARRGGELRAGADALWPTRREVAVVFTPACTRKDPDGDER